MALGNRKTGERKNGRIIRLAINMCIYTHTLLKTELAGHNIKIKSNNRRKVNFERFL